MNNSAHFYEVSVQWDHDRKGTITSPVQSTAIEVATPPQFPKGMEGIWSPEELFTAAVNSCLMTTFLAIADNSKLHFTGFTSKSYGKLDMVDGKYVMSEITLMPVVTITDEAEREKAIRILQKSEAACLISNSIISKINFQPEVVVAALTPAS